MPPTTNPIDLTTLAAVKSWLGPNTGSTEDQVIQDCITALSAYVQRLCARGPADGTIPTSSPFVAPVSYDEIYDGTGNDRLRLRNWPITAVASVNAAGMTFSASSGLTSPGYVIDGDKKFLVLRFGGSPAYPQRYRGAQYAKCGWPLGTQNIEVQYTAGFTGIPQDLEFAVRKIVAFNYKRRQWIGQASQAMAAGAGTVSFTAKQDEKEFWDLVQYYKARSA